MSVDHAKSRPVGSITQATAEDVFLMGTATPADTSKSLGDLASHPGAPRRVWAVCQRSDRECNAFNDSAAMRVEWFRQALAKLEAKTVAVHYRLGCPDTMRDQSLWMQYRNELNKWEKENKERLVVIYTPAEAIGGHVNMVTQHAFRAFLPVAAAAAAAEIVDDPPIPIGIHSVKRKREQFMKAAETKAVVDDDVVEVPPPRAVAASAASSSSVATAAASAASAAAAPAKHQTQLSSTWYVSKRRKTGVSLPITPGVGATVLVCGDRYWNNKERIESVLATLDPSVKIVHGGCTGADALAGEVGQEQKRTVFCEPADWKQHGRAAGPIRNAHMLKAYVPCLVIAFHDRMEESKGTKDMLTQANKANVPTVVFKTT